MTYDQAYSQAVYLVDSGVVKSNLKYLADGIYNYNHEEAPESDVQENNDESNKI